MDLTCTSGPTFSQLHQWVGRLWEDPSRELIQVSHPFTPLHTFRCLLAKWIHTLLCVLTMPWNPSSSPFNPTLRLTIPYIPYSLPSMYPALRLLDGCCGGLRCPHFCRGQHPGQVHVSRLLKWLKWPNPLWLNPLWPNSPGCRPSQHLHILCNLQV